MNRGGSTFLNTGVLCCTVFLSAGVAEVVLRLTNVSPPVRMGWVGKHYDPPGPDLTADPDTGWKMKPNQAFVWQREGRDNEYRANSAGFRSNHEFDPADSRRRIALVGDSYTWGSGVAYQDTFAALLEKDSSGEVAWNFGMPGFGVDQVWLSARHKALPMHPDLLVVGLINADFERSQVPHREGFDKPTFKLQDGSLVRRTLEPAPSAFMQYLDWNSHLWATLERSKRWMGTHHGFTEYWTLNKAILDALRHDCEQAGVPVLFVYIPIKSFKPFPAVRDYMRRTEANYIDLTLQQPRPPMSIYLPHDGHLSPEGHRYVANLIEAWIKDHAALTERRP